MTQFLPPNLLALFAARDPIPYYPPVDKLSHEKKRVPYSGVAQFFKEFENPKDTPPPTRIETKEERKERKRKERAEQIAYKLEQDLALWDPNNNPESSSDPYKTLFVARINYDTSESKLRREFEVFGPIRRIRMINDSKSAKMRGYAFIEYEHERDMHSAYKHADGRKIDGRRVLVDVERGRTVKGWRPRRLGGGLGGTRKGGPEENTRFSGRDEFNPGREGYREDRMAGGGRERSRSRERERVGPGAGGGGGVGGPGRRVRSRSRERRRSRSRERGVRARSRSRSRERRRSRERDDKVSEGEEEVRVKDRKRRRSRSRERRRSRSRDRKGRGSRRSRSRERRRSRERGRAGEKLEPNAGDVPPPPIPNYDDDGSGVVPREIKQEPIDPGYDMHPSFPMRGGPMASGGPGDHNVHFGMPNGSQPPPPSHPPQDQQKIEDGYDDYEDN